MDEVSKQNDPSTLGEESSICQSKRRKTPSHTALRHRRTEVWNTNPVTELYVTELNPETLTQPRNFVTEELNPGTPIQSRKFVTEEINPETSQSRNFMSQKN